MNDSEQAPRPAAEGAGRGGGAGARHRGGGQSGGVGGLLFDHTSAAAKAVETAVHASVHVVVAAAAPRVGTNAAGDFSVMAAALGRRHRHGSRASGPVGDYRLRQRREAFLFGRRTYEIFAGYWPTIDPSMNPIAAALNSRPNYVVDQPHRPQWADTGVLTGE